MPGGALKPERGVLEVRRSEWQDAPTPQMGLFQQPALARFDFVYHALHIEVAFHNGVVLAVEDLLEATHRLGHGDLFALPPGEDLRHAEWLAQEALNLAGAQHR